MTDVNPSKARREREREALRREIVGAARTLFVKRGYASVTMRAIARKIGYTATAIYYHFPDKETLVHAVCDEDLRTLSDHLKRIGRGADPVDRIRKMGLAYTAFGLEHPQSYQMLFMNPGPPHDPARSEIEHGNPEQDAYAFLVRAAAEAIQAGRFRPGITDADLVAQVLWSAVHGVVALRLAMSEDRWIEWRPALKTAELLIDRLLDGLTVGVPGGSPKEEHG